MHCGTNIQPYRVGLQTDDSLMPRADYRRVHQYDRLETETPRIEERRQQLSYPYIRLIFIDFVHLSLKDWKICANVSIGLFRIRTERPKRRSHGNIQHIISALEADFSALMRYINSRFTYLLTIIVCIGLHCTVTGVDVAGQAKKIRFIIFNM